MHEPARVFANVLGDADGTGHIHDVSHRRVELALFESAVADRIEDAAKSILIEKLAQFRGVVDIECHNPGTVEPVRSFRAGTDDLARIASVQVVKGVETGDSRDAGYQEGQRRRRDGKRRRDGYRFNHKQDRSSFASVFASLSALLAPVRLVTISSKLYGRRVLGIPDMSRTFGGLLIMAAAIAGLGAWRIVPPHGAHQRQLGARAETQSR